MADDATHGGPDAATTASLLRRRLERGPLWVDAGGSSMQPTIPPGSEVLVRAKAEPAPGEIWCVVDEAGELVVHRVDRRWAGVWILRGDGNDHDDAPVGADRLVGEVTASRRDDVEQTFGRWHRGRWRVRSLVRRAPAAVKRRVVE